MYRRRRFASEIEIEDIKAQISALKIKIHEADATPSECASEDDIAYEDVVKILKKESASLKEFIEFETKKKEKLVEEAIRLSKYIEEEESIISCCEDYMKKNWSFKTEEVIDKQLDLYFKTEVLHRKICMFIKRFSRKLNLNMEPDLPVPSKVCTKIESADAIPKKSLLDILKLLIFELNSNDFNDEGFSPEALKVDDTMEAKHIEFLLSANIIEKCAEDPDCIKLSI